MDWEAMENDGYDIVDDNGNINIEDPGAGMGGSESACLEAAPDDNLQLTFLIPTTPELLNTPDQLGTVENLGVSLDGIPLTGDPPSVTQGPPKSLVVTFHLSTLVVVIWIQLDIITCIFSRRK